MSKLCFLCGLRTSEYTLHHRNFKIDVVMHLCDYCKKFEIQKLMNILTQKFEWAFEDQTQPKPQAMNLNKSEVKENDSTN